MFDIVLHIVDTSSFIALKVMVYWVFLALLPTCMPLQKLQNAKSIRTFYTASPREAPMTLNVTDIRCVLQSKLASGSQNRSNMRGFKNAVLWQHSSF